MYQKVKTRSNYGQLDLHLGQELFHQMVKKHCIASWIL